MARDEMRVCYPVKLTQKQLNRITYYLASEFLMDGFRVRMEITYYFVLSDTGNIHVLRANGYGYSVVQAELSSPCKNIFFNRCIPYMMKHGWNTACLDENVAEHR